MMGALDWPTSWLAEPEGFEDHVAREWVLSMGEAFALDAQGLPDTAWLHASYKWGPSRWPMRWSDLLTCKELDCGAFAVITQTMFDARGIECARIQWIEEASPSETTHWARLWRDADVDSCGWIIDEHHVYHEALATIVEGRGVIYDSTLGHVVSPRMAGVPKVVCLRLCAQLGVEVRWGDVPLVANEWKAGLV